MFSRRVRLIWALILVAGCAVYSRHELDERFGPADPARYDRVPVGDPSVDFWRDVKPVLDNRCVVCHGCYDAPCQLQTTSYEGVTRGANKDTVYDSARLRAAEPSRLFVDAQSNAEWRKKGFYPVLNEREPTPQANREDSVLYRMLAMKQNHSWPGSGLLPSEDFDLSLTRAQYCPRIEEFDRFEREHPAWGMPYGLPPVSAHEHATLVHWLETGAPYREPEPLTPAQRARVEQWEAFLNGDSVKEQLASRYIYEHWYLAHLYFDDLEPRRFFELVRSKTPPNVPIDVIATRLPYDDPGVSRVYYRLRPIHSTLVAKTHMPYALNAERLQRLKAWFVDAAYRVTALPSYVPEQAANPFLTFKDIPVPSRYRFMLDEAQYTIMGFIKGPVCRGQVAVDVITDYFWVAFLDPGQQLVDDDSDFLTQTLANLRLPDEDVSSEAPLRSWMEYSGSETRYLKAKSDVINLTFGENSRPTLDLVWRGDGQNPNAALTVFRHFDSASVVQGFVGESPQTAWLIGYPLLERIHYLLVAGFDVYGNLVHQVHSRLYMDFLRMEGEFNFLALLPKNARDAVLDQWYRGAVQEVQAYLNGTKAHFDHETGIRYQTDQPYPELVELLKHELASVQNRRYELASSKLSQRDLFQLGRLAGLQGRSVSHLPEASVLTVRDEHDQDHFFTVLRNSAHSNVAHLFDEADRRLPDEDTVTLVTGFIGAYPNAFYLVKTADLPVFVDTVRDLSSESDYSALMARFGLRRTDTRFWSYSDAVHAAYRRWAPVEAALFDYNRFENR